jgi:small subunit ribosomal protein S20
MAEQKATEKAEKTEKKTRRPSALKRDLQAEKRRLRNRSFRSSVSTAIKALETALTNKEDAAKIQTQLREIQSIVDKGVKKGIYKLNKGSRTKSRLEARCAKAV